MEKKTSRKFLLLLGVASLLWTACTPRQTAQPPVEFQVVDAKTLQATGSLAYGAAARLGALLTPGIREIRLQGDLHSAPDEYLQVAALITSQHLNVHVTDLCVGGCANTLFLTANSRSFGPNGVVAFHGGLGSFTEAEYAANLAKFGHTTLEQRRYLEHWRGLVAQEAELLRRAGVDISLLRDARVLGELYREQNGLESQPTVTPLWVPSEREQTCYGVRNIKQYNAGLTEARMATLRQEQELALFRTADLRDFKDKVSACVQ
ncbi:hypothetical protein [Deinococcus navajonensis]|uniref:Lipoprotein n=1 Tax=Deinococcus navajonensis TaxID=309884 RepID=A0ABV8XJ98_9DEIO